MTNTIEKQRNGINIYNLSANQIFKIYKNCLGLHCIAVHCHHSSSLFKSSSMLHSSLSQFSQRQSSVQEVSCLAQLQRRESHPVLHRQRSSFNASSEWSWQDRHSTATHSRIHLEYQALLLSLHPRRGIIIEPWVCADIKQQTWEVVAPCSCLDFSSTCPIWHLWQFSITVVHAAHKPL